jgi:ABC-type polysaccharide transport system permease subunit
LLTTVLLWWQVMAVELLPALQVVVVVMMMLQRLLHVLQVQLTRMYRLMEAMHSLLLVTLLDCLAASRWTVMECYHLSSAAALLMGLTPHVVFPSSLVECHCCPNPVISWQENGVLPHC